MSRTRREWGAEQGHLKEGSFYATAIGPSLLRELEEDAGLYPDAFWFAKVWIRPEIVGSWHGADKFLIGERDLKAFVRYVCPRLQERQRLREENERLRRELQDERRRANEAEEEARVANEELNGWMTGNKRLLEHNRKLQQDISEAQRAANEARGEASSIQQKLRKTETAFTEAKRKFISAPDLVPCLQSLGAEVKTLQTNVKTAAEAMMTRPVEGRRSSKTLQQMKRVLHDIGRYPQRRRRAKATDAADDGGGAIKRGRLCYMCRCKGHLAKDCPQARTDTVASADPTTSDMHQRAEGSQEANAESGWSVFSVFRRTFTSEID